MRLPKITEIAPLNLLSVSAPGSKSYVFQNKEQIVWKCVKGGSFQVFSFKTLQIFVSFVSILCSWISFVNWNVKQIQLFSTKSHIYTFRIDNNLGLFWEFALSPKLLISAPVQANSVSVSNGSVNALST